MLKFYSIFVSCFMFVLTGCGHTLMPLASLVPPANLVTPCPPLRQLNSPSGGAILRWDIEAAKAYAECQSRHQRLVEAWPTARGKP